MLPEKRMAYSLRPAAAAPAAAPELVDRTPRKGPCSENQWFRPRLVRGWYLGRTIRQLAKREHVRPSLVEAVLREETVAASTHPPVARCLRRVA
jgi:hypothetical protein